MPPPARMEFPRSVESPSRARSFVRGLLAEWRIEDPEDTTVLLTSEVVSNAVVHAATELEVTISLDDDRDTVHVEVLDHDEHTIVLDDPDWESQRGRGLVLVDCLARAWGSRTVDGGKVVWFDVDVHPNGAS